MGFEVSFSNVLVTLVYMLFGFLLCKGKKVSAEHLSSLTGVLIYVCSPCVVLNSFLQLKYTPRGFGLMALFFAASLLLQALFMLILFLIFRKKYQDSRYRILTCSSVLGNVGYLGLTIVKALLPDNPEVVCYATVYGASMNILVFTMGVFCLTNDKKYISLKPALFNPLSITLLPALLLYFFGVGKYLPAVVTNGISLVGNMTTPLCMMIVGVRLATVPFKKLFMRPMIYLICGLKLIVFPLFCYLAVYFLPLDFSFKASMLILSAVPCATSILSMAELYRSETELAANCVLLSALLCVITIPVIGLIL